MGSHADVVVIGAGVIGLSCAWRLAQQGAQVALVDDEGPAASDVAAGMLAPVTESTFGEDALLALNLVALQHFSAFVAQLDDTGGTPVPVLRTGTLSVGTDPDDRAELARLGELRESLGLSTRSLTSREVRSAEPYLSTSVTSAVLAADELSVDNRGLRDSLRRNVSAAGVQRVVGTGELVVRGGRAVGVRVAEAVHPADVVVLAAGARSAGLVSLAPEASPPVVPVKGHVLRLRPLPQRPVPRLLTRTVRALVHGHEVYLVPRDDGEIVVGATVEHQGHDLTVAAAAVRTLLRDAQEVLPAVDELALAEVSTGLRPGTPDNGPVVGWSALPGLLLATGHYRNGILLSGVTGEEVARQASGSPPSDVWRAFSPHRFQHAEVGS